MRVTVLGCSTSSGVPQIGCACAVCRSPDPRNKRRRCAIFIEVRGQRILVDTGPDLRQQCLDAGIGAIDALLYTHAHADHVFGTSAFWRPGVPIWAHERFHEQVREQRKLGQALLRCGPPFVPKRRKIGQSTRRLPPR